MAVPINFDALFFALEESQTGNELLEVIDSFISESVEDWLTQTKGTIRAEFLTLCPFYVIMNSITNRVATM